LRKNKRQTFWESILLNGSTIIQFMVQISQIKRSFFKCWINLKHWRHKTFTQLLDLKTNQMTIVFRFLSQFSNLPKKVKRLLTRSPKKVKLKSIMNRSRICSTTNDFI
jgi:hypothetical protein